MVVRLRKPAVSTITGRVAGAQLLDHLRHPLLGLGDHRYGAERPLRIVALGQGSGRIGVDQRRLAAESKPVGGEAAGEGGFADAALGRRQRNDIVPGRACHVESPESHPPMRRTLRGMNS